MNVCLRQDKCPHVTREFPGFVHQKDDASIVPHHVTMIGSPLTTADYTLTQSLTGLLDLPCDYLPIRVSGLSQK